MKISKQTKDTVFKLYQYTEAIRSEINAEIPPQQILIFYLIALNEGIGQVEIANMLAMPEGTVSRNVSKLCARMRRTPEGGVAMVGYGLLETRQDDVDDSRKKCVYLTDKGVRVLTRLTTIFN